MKPNQDEPTLQQLLNSPSVKRRFEELLNQSAPSFISSILAIFNANKKLQECPARSILSAAGVAAALKLPINPNLGFAFLVPFKGQATFQLGAKGFVQLAMRSGQYRTLNAGAVREGQIADVDFETGEIIRGEKVSDDIVGYIAYMELLNGFKKSLYMSNEEIHAHAEKYSQSYAYDINNGKKTSVWSKNFDAMATKTVLKRLLSKYGIISIDQQDSNLALALQADQALITEDGFRYLDNEQGDGKVVPFGDVLELPNPDDETDDDTDDDNSPDDKPDTPDNPDTPDDTEDKHD